MNKIDLLNRNIPSLYFIKASPIVMGMLLFGANTLIEAWFITQYIGIDEFSAAFVFYPISLAFLGLSQMLGSGLASLVSKNLGAGKLSYVNALVNMTFLISLVLSISVSLIFYLFRYDVVLFLGAGESIVETSISYATPLILSLPMTIFVGVYRDLIRAHGHAFQYFITMSVGVFSSCIFNSILIPYLGFGVEGASMALVLSNIIVLFYMFFIMRKLGGTLKVSFKLSTLEAPLKNMLQVFYLGFPVFVTNAFIAISITSVNYLIANNGGDMAGEMLAAFGLNVRVFSFLILPLLAIQITMQSIVGFNYGANYILRVRSSILFAILIATGYGLIISAIMVLFPNLVFGFFTDDSHSIWLASEYAFIYFSGFFLLGAQVVCVGAYQALGDAKISNILSVLKIPFIFFPILIALFFLLGVDQIIFVYPLTEIVSFSLCLIFFYILFSKKTNLI